MLSSHDTIDYVRWRASWGERANIPTPSLYGTSMGGERLNPGKGFWQDDLSTSYEKIGVDWCGQPIWRAGSPHSCRFEDLALACFKFWGISTLSARCQVSGMAGQRPTAGFFAVAIPPSARSCRRFGRCRSTITIQPGGYRDA